MDSHEASLGVAVRPQEWKNGSRSGALSSGVGGSGSHSAVLPGGAEPTGMRLAHSRELSAVVGAPSPLQRVSFSSHIHFGAWVDGLGCFC